MATRTILEYRNPEWANPEETIFDLEVKFAEIVENGTPVFIPFSVADGDPEAHGQFLWQQYLDGTITPSPYEAV